MGIYIYFTYELNIKLLSSHSEALLIKQDLHLSHRIDSTISLIYLGVIATGIAWVIRFRILKNNGLVFQAQVAYLIPIFGVILGFIFLNEMITPKVIISLVAVIIGIYLVKKSTSKSEIKADSIIQSIV